MRATSMPALTRAGQMIARGVTDVVADLEVDVHEAAGGSARSEFGRVALMLAIMDDEMEAYRPLREVDHDMETDDYSDPDDLSS